MKKIYLLAALLFLYIWADAQEISIRKADEILGSGNVEQALKEYREKLHFDQTNPEYMMRVGYCMLNLPEHLDSSVTYLQNAADMYKSAKKKFSAAEARFYLAQALRKLYRFDEAKEIFDALIKEFKNKSDFVKIVQAEINICSGGKELTQDTLNAKIINLKIINSGFTDHSPVLSGDQNLLIFTSKRNSETDPEPNSDGEYNENIYFTTKDAGKWLNPVSIGNEINTDKQNANCGISFDGKKLFVYVEGDIYVSERNDNGWSKPVPTEIPVNSKHRELDFFLNEAENLAIFASDRPGGFGGIDLYKVRKDENGNWSEPINLGKEVNTEFDDNGIFIHHDGTIYFSSKGHENLGGYDIFSSRPDENGNYSQAKNVGYPVNSSEDDFSFFLSLDKKRAYFASSRAGGLGKADIYTVNFADSSKKYLLVKGKITTDDNAQNKIDAQFTALNTSKTHEKTSTQSDGSYQAVVKKGQDYFVSYTSRGYFFENTVIKAPKDTTSARKTIPVVLQKVNSENVNKKYVDQFDKKSENLNLNNELYLQTLTEFLKENPDLNVDISCGSGGDKELDDKRIETVIKYLKSNGITENRISANLYPTDEKSNNAQYTILDKNTKFIAFNDKVNNTQVGDNDKPDSGNLLKGNYTIQIGAFSKKKEKSDKYFKRLGGKVKIYLSSDQLFRYTFGKYTYMTEAEKNLEILHKLGYKDAFIRDINWYKSETE